MVGLGRAWSLYQESEGGQWLCGLHHTDSCHSAIVNIVPRKIIKEISRNCFH